MVQYRNFFLHLLLRFSNFGFYDIVSCLFFFFFQAPRCLLGPLVSLLCGMYSGGQLFSCHQQISNVHSVNTGQQLKFPTALRLACVKTSNISLLPTTRSQQSSLRNHHISRPTFTLSGSQFWRHRSPPLSGVLLTDSALDPVAPLRSKKFHSQLSFTPGFSFQLS